MGGIPTNYRGQVLNPTKVSPFYRAPAHSSAGSGGSQELRIPFGSGRVAVHGCCSCGVAARALGVGAPLSQRSRCRKHES